MNDVPTFPWVSISPRRRSASDLTGVLNGFATFWNVRRG